MEKIEKQNSININVFRYENKSIFPIRISGENYDDHIELLLIEGKINNTMSISKILID